MSATLIQFPNQRMLREQSATTCSASALRERILDAAFRAYASETAPWPSIEDIAREAAVSVAEIEKLFGTGPRLLEEVLRSLMAIAASYMPAE